MGPQVIGESNEPMKPMATWGCHSCASVVVSAVVEAVVAATVLAAVVAAPVVVAATVLAAAVVAAAVVTAAVVGTAVAAVTGTWLCTAMPFTLPMAMPPAGDTTCSRVRM